MKRIVPYIAVIALVGAGLTACDRSKTAYNNSGSTATPSSTTAAGTTTSPAPTTSSTTETTTSSSAGNVVSDTVTSGKIMTAFTADPGLKDSDISVKSEGGVVTLSGTVKSQDQIVIAQNLAKSQEGVNRVETQITVR